MIKSMTGYGAAKGSGQGLDIVVELKSVNNRYMDCSVRIPRSFLFAEEGIKSAVSRRLARGKVDVFVTVDSTGAEALEVKVNEALADGYCAAIRALAERCGLPDELTAVQLSRCPDVLTVKKADADADAIAAAMLEITENALTAFDAMRCAEGQKLAEDIAVRLDVIEGLVARLEERSPETVKEYREKLLAKMNEVLSGAGVDEQRILTEAAIYADKVAVDEETVRLRSHIAQMRGFLQTGSPIGRKMDFLVQEFNREANTIGSKCSDTEMSRVVIEIKSEIEKIREQVQNIE